MTPSETVVLTRYVKACCPASQIDEYTPDAWHDLLGELELGDCKTAVQSIAKRQPFAAASDIRAEVRVIRRGRLARSPLPAPPAEVADEPGRYQRIVQANIKRIADGMSIRAALPAGEALPGDPPPEWRDAREVLAGRQAQAPAKDPQEIAREQAEESRKERADRVGTEEAS